MTSPTALRALREEHLLEITWPDSRVDRISFFDLRCACPCAVCIDEITGRQLLQPSAVADDVKPLALGFAGNYGLKVQWSDGHSTGIYSWDRLRALGAMPSATEPPSSST